MHVTFAKSYSSCELNEPSATSSEAIIFVVQTSIIVIKTKFTTLGNCLIVCLWLRFKIEPKKIHSFCCAIP